MKFLTSVFVSLCSFALLAQPQLAFEEEDHDFGEIKEEDGFAEFTFNFVNEGDEAIKITNVKASCGCTTPGWTREAVDPGEAGYIKVRYNPRNRPGKFRKSLRISTSNPASNKTLYIQGFVKPKPKTPVEQYPILAGDFRVAFQTFNLGKITTEKVVMKSFDIYNGGDSIAALPALNLPDHIAIELLPSSLKPREIGKLKITYDPNKKNDYGFVSDNVKLTTEGDKDFSVMAIIEEYFPEMTAEELDAAPKLTLSERVFDFDKVTQGEVVQATFELRNEGNEKLEFRTIKSNCDCISYDFKSKFIKKGKGRKLVVSFDTSDLRGNQYKSISIYSNDPVNPTQLITLKGKVEKEK